MISDQSNNLMRNFNNQIDSSLFSYILNFCIWNLIQNADNNAV